MNTWWVRIRWTVGYRRKLDRLFDYSFFSSNLEYLTCDFPFVLLSERSNYQECSMLDASWQTMTHKKAETAFIYGKNWFYVSTLPTVMGDWSSWVLWHQIFKLKKISQQFSFIEIKVLTARRITHVLIYDLLIFSNIHQSFYIQLI